MFHARAVLSFYPSRSGQSNFLTLKVASFLPRKPYVITKKKPASSTHSLRDPWIALEEAFEVSLYNKKKRSCTMARLLNYLLIKGTNYSRLCLLYPKGIRFRCLNVGDHKTTHFPFHYLAPDLPSAAVTLPLRIYPRSYKMLCVDAILELVSHLASYLLSTISLLSNLLIILKLNYCIVIYGYERTTPD
jgi:hypothetical protein